MTANIAWDSVAPAGYPGNQNEASQRLFVNIYDDQGTLLAGAGYRDHWGLHSADRYLGTAAGDSGVRVGELPLAGSAVFEVTRVGDTYTLIWDSIVVFSIASSADSVAEVQLEFSTFDPSLDRFTPRSYLGTLSVDRIEFSGTLELDTVDPTAVAGPNQAIHSGDVVMLDGSGSFDDVTASADLTYTWSILSAPAGSGATLIGADTSTPSFTADLPGTFEIELVVTDEAGNDSEPDVVEVSSNNVAPEADAGTDIVILVGTTTVLDGTGSTDADGDALTFWWTILSSPDNSSPLLIGPGSSAPSFTPDLPGIYEIELVVNDGFASSVPDAVLITAISGQEYAESMLQAANDVVANLPDSAFDAIGHRNSLSNLISQAIDLIQQDKISQAIDKIDSIIRRTDGCALRGAPDGNGQERDWIVDSCDSQNDLYPLLIDARSALESL